MESDGEREIVVNRVSDNTLDMARWSGRMGWMTMFSEFLSAKQVNSGFANSVTTDGYAAMIPRVQLISTIERMAIVCTRVHIKRAIRATTTTARSFRERAEAE